MRRAGRPRGRRVTGGRRGQPTYSREAASINEPQNEQEPVDQQDPLNDHVPDPVPVPPAFEISEASLERIARMLARLVPQPQPPPQQPPPQYPPPPQPHQDRPPSPRMMEGYNHSIERARRLGAQDFDGDSDPDAALRWLEKTERVFGIMGCPDENKVAIAVFLLQGSAFHWWESVLTQATEDIVWEEFKRLFQDYFYPMIHRDMRVEDFYQLRQNDMTVNEYVRQFLELARAAPFVVDNEVRKCTKFRNGLRHEIKIHVGIHRQFGPLVEDAKRVETDLLYHSQSRRGKQRRYEADWSSGGSSNKTPRTGSSSGRSTRFRQSDGSGSSQGSVRPPVRQRGSSFNRGHIPQCPSCGRHHGGECRGSNFICYNCGQTGHIRKNCPELNVTQSGDSQQVSQGPSGSRQP